MEAALIQSLAPMRAAQRGFEKYSMNYRHFVVPANQTKEVLANEQIYFLVGEVDGVFIRSAYGEYDRANILSDEHEHEHTGQILIQNLTSSAVEVSFLQLNLK